MPPPSFDAWQPSYQNGEPLGDFATWFDSNKLRQRGANEAADTRTAALPPPPPPRNALNARVIVLKSDATRVEFVERAVRPRVPGVAVVDAVVGADVAAVQGVMRELNVSLNGGFRDQATCGQVGCALSHLLVWQEIIDDGLPHAVVLEDDARVPDDFALRTTAMLEELNARGGAWDICYLYVWDAHWGARCRDEAHGRAATRAGRNAESARAAAAGFYGTGSKGPTCDAAPGCTHIAPGGRSFCTLAYLVSNRGAKKLRRFSRPLCAPIDNMIIAFVERRENSVLSFWPTEQFVGNGGQKSSAEPVGGDLLKSNVWGGKRWAEEEDAVLARRAAARERLLARAAAGGGAEAT